MKDVRDFINNKIKQEIQELHQGDKVKDPAIENAKQWKEDQKLQKILNDKFNEDQPILFFDITPMSYNKGIEINWDYVNSGGKRGRPTKSSKEYLDYCNSIKNILKRKDYVLFDDQPINLKIEIFRESDGNDLDNLEKPIIDSICRHYRINDNKIRAKSSVKKCEKGEGQFLVQFLKITELELLEDSLLEKYNNNPEKRVKDKQHKSRKL